MSALRFRAPAHAVPLLELLARALPGIRAERIAAWVSRGGVRVDGAPAPGARSAAPPGALVVAREAPFAARAFEPGPARRGSGAWLALAPEPPWRRGVLEARAGGGAAPGQGGALRFELGETREGVASLRLEAGDASALAIARALAGAGFPLLGDPLHGGVLVAGGLRLRAADERPSQADDAWWPDEPVFLPTWEPSHPGATLRVSGGTFRALARGHPWVLPDRETGDTGRFRPGTLVRLVPREEARQGGRPGARAGREPAGRAGGPIVCVEGGAVAARLWAVEGAGRGAASVEARVARALALRRELVAATPSATGTNAFRLLHGEADGLPGLAADRLGPLLRVVVSGRACEGFRERAVDALVRSLARELGAEPPVVEVLHLRERPRGELEGVRLARGRRSDLRLEPDGRLVVRERGLSFLVDPGLAAPTEPAPAVGLFLDQRENRARVAARARRGGRWLNLFAHTGAFSVALLAAGADEVVSVDLSKAYLRWLDENLERNGLAGRAHRAVSGDGRRVLERWPAGERFDGIVIDPPTAAAAGRRFWSVRRDLPALVEEALRRLAPGGSLLVCRNDRSARGSLRALVQAAAGRAGAALASVGPASAGPDFPSLAGFPEGDPFEGVLAQRRTR